MVKRFKEKRNIYGRVLHHEMIGHRYGDKAIIDNDPVQLDIMIRHYEKSQRLALKCKSLKHIFTPFYWAGHYYYEMKDKENCIKYHKLNLQFMEKYCPDARDGYREKARTSIVHLKEHMPQEEWSKIHKWIKKCKNRCIIKVKRAI